eukprot:349651-Chlamydomonas_euryale.AAC.12
MESPPTGRPPTLPPLVPHLSHARVPGMPRPFHAHPPQSGLIRRHGSTCAGRVKQTVSVGV